MPGREEDNKNIAAQEGVGNKTEPTPEESGIGGEKFRSSVLLVVQDSFRALRDKVDRVDSIMSLTVIVLFVGFITILIALAGIVIQSWQFNSNTQRDLQISIEDLRRSVESESKMIDRLNNQREQLNGQSSESSGLSQ